MDLKKINLLSHHAYAVIGPQSIKSELIEQLSKKNKIEYRANPDFIDRSFDTFTIDDAREIKSLHESRPLSDGAKKIFILSMNGITIEAQNALLKLLEEPSEYAHFFLIIPSSHLLLPTVKSRIQLIESGKPSESDKTEAKKFIKSSPPKRLEQVKELVDEISKDKKTKQEAIDFLNDVQEVLYKEKGAKEAMKSLEAIDHARKYMNDRSPSVKMLLEYVALNI